MGFIVEGKLVSCMPEVRHLHAGVEDPDGEWEWGMEQEREARPWDGHVMQETHGIPTGSFCSVHSLPVSCGPWPSPL
jgi:hypothetical protein